MRRREFLGASATAGLVGLAGCRGSADEQGFEDGFEDGMNGWETGAHIGPEIDLDEFEWTTPELSTDTLFVAVGTAVVWEADATHFVDDVSVELEAR